MYLCSRIRATLTDMPRKRTKHNRSEMYNGKVRISYNRLSLMFTALRLTNARGHKIKTDPKTHILSNAHLTALTLISLIELSGMAVTYTNFRKLTTRSIMGAYPLSSVYIHKQLRVLTKFQWLEIYGSTLSVRGKEQPLYRLTPKSWKLIRDIDKEYWLIIDNMDQILLENKREKRLKYHAKLDKK